MHKTQLYGTEIHNLQEAQYRKGARNNHFQILGIKECVHYRKVMINVSLAHNTAVTLFWVAFEIPIKIVYQKL